MTKTSATHSAGLVTAVEMTEARRWVASHFEASADPPLFSFIYDGHHSAELLRGWRLRKGRKKLDANRVQHTVIYTDPKTGLVARCTGIAYEDFPTVEWTLHLRNTGTTDTPILSEVLALNTCFDRGVDSEIVLHHHTGDNCSPGSYEPHELRLSPSAEHSFAPVGGRPTNGAFPYFNVDWQSGGVIVVIGWPGQWSARFTREDTKSSRTRPIIEPRRFPDDATESLPNRSRNRGVVVGRVLRISAGQERTHFTLHPGEEVRTPLIALQFWKVDRVRAQNVWRRWMLAHNLPRAKDGHLPTPILSSCSGGFFPGLMCNEADEFRFIDTYLKEGIQLDYWWMDAGWYPCGDAGWPKVGTWEPDTERFPHGIKAVSDHAHAKGAKLILWFEPERVAPGTWLADNHSEWVLGGKSGGLLNLGNSEARKWLTDHVDRFLTEQGIDLYRQDFNMDPLSFWRANDSEDRQGITEIRHVEGYLAYWDDLRLRHPGMLIDSCASGGRRNDLETLRRAVPLLRSDYQSFSGDPSYAPGNQCHTYGLSCWIPYYGQGTYYNDNQLVYNARSHFCPSFGFCWDVRKPGVDWGKFRRLVTDWRQIAHCFLGDYYPLTPYTQANDRWMAWQFHRADLDEGVVQAFRRSDCSESSVRLGLHGLNARATYTLRDLDTPGERRISGRELMEPGPGFAVVIEDRPGSAIITYNRK